MVTSVFLLLIYLFFPLLCYFLYLVYNKAIFEKEKLLFLDLALFSSYYLFSKYANLNLFSCFLINIPFLLSLYKKRYAASIILSFLTSVFLLNFIDINFYVLFLGYLIIFLFSYYKKSDMTKYFAVFQLIFIILAIIFLPGKIINMDSFGFIIIAWLITYVLFYLIIFMFSKIESVVSLYNSLEEITREKRLYQSLFKITHEIKNPLAVCKGYLDMFDIKDEIKANKYIGIIDQEIDRTLLLLKDFSNISKIKIEKSLIDINLLLEDVCDEAKLIFKNNINFEYYLSDEEIYINGDYNRLKQVFVNVIKNAKEAIKDSGNVTIKTKIIKNKFIIRIIDDGVGMDGETKKQIGTAFYTTKKNGTGLGVCFSKEIIEKHYGTIKYNSKVGKGTSVTITLPIEKR